MVHGLLVSLLELFQNKSVPEFSPCSLIGTCFLQGLSDEHMDQNDGVAGVSVDKLFPLFRLFFEGSREQGTPELFLWLEIMLWTDR